MDSRSYAWLDRLIKAELLMERRSVEYQATLDDPDALIASPAWEAFSQAAERRDALRDKHWKELLSLAASASKGD
jgi:hypothetical protein